MIIPIGIFTIMMSVGVRVVKLHFFMKHTNVFVSKEELTDLKVLASLGWQDGDTIMVSSMMMGISKDRSTTDAEWACHKLALEKGLPEIQGKYGITKKGEFVHY